MNRHYNRQLGCRLRNERGEKSEEEEEVQQLPWREGQGEEANHGWWARMVYIT